MERLFEREGIELPPEALELIVKNNLNLKIPSKVEVKLTYFKQEELKEIHEDLITAKELILFVLHSFNETYILSRNSSNERVRLGYKKISSKVLRSKVEVGKKDNYKKILNLLIKYEILEKGRNYFAGRSCTEYRLTNRYFGKGIVNYEIKSKILKKRHAKFEESNIKKVIQCPIALNELINRNLLVFPTQEEARLYLEEQSNKGVENRKGKKLVYRKDIKIDNGDYVFIEDYLVILDYLSKLNIPIIVSENGGERVITAYNFLPSILRKMIKIGKDELKEVDYSCLHPNIVNKIYSGSGSTITHEIVADYLGISKTKAKLEHLSFFNKTWEKMNQSPLFKYYSKKEGNMMTNLYFDKKENGHKVTSKKCFKIETEMQRETVSNLRSLGVICFYVFDAIVTLEGTLEDVRNEMCSTAENFQIKIKC